MGWIGAVCAYLTLAFAVPATHDPATVEAAWTGMELVGWYAIVPLAVGSFVTGILLALVTRWGLAKHYWVLISLVSTTVLTAVLLLHMPDVSAQAEVARGASGEHLTRMGSDIPHAVIALALLVGILMLNIYKPRGMTRYGWRKDREARTRAAARRAL